MKINFCEYPSSFLTAQDITGRDAHVLGLSMSLVGRVTLEILSRSVHLFVKEQACAGNTIRKLV